MNRFKTVIAAMVVVCVAVSGLFAQSGSSGSEMSVEESYLQESVEVMIIREQSRADDRDGKLVALAYIQEAIDHGNTGEEIRVALEYMGLEGILNQTRENGRLMNNYPDIRRQAAAYLGKLGTVEAKNTLIKMMLIDNEPMVLTEIIRSLSSLLNAGITDGMEETISAVAWIVRRYDTTTPDNLLALAALDLFDTCGRINNGFRDPEAIQSIRRIAAGRYIRPVQDRAKNLITVLVRYGQNANR